MRTTFKLLWVCVVFVAANTKLSADPLSPETLTLDTTAPMLSTGTEAGTVISTATLAAMPPVRALHVTAWEAGSKKFRKELNEQIFKGTVINSVVIDIKEYEGEVYIPGVKMADDAHAYQPAMPDIQAWVAELKQQGIYTVARMVTFKDNIMPRYKKALGVHTADGDLWQDRSKITWLDPYNLDAWRYNLSIALQAARLGFDEVQFDYIRFPTDGNLKSMHFAKPYSRNAASRALVGFLHQAARLLHPLGTKISIDVFGLTTSVNTGMGIGQVMKPMADQVDFVCPMTYPSHYAKGEYGIPNPNDEPYKTVHLAMHDALKALGPAGYYKLRPYLQDFSLKGRGIRYGAKEVREQIKAAADQGIASWTLWNARCVYTLSALKEPITVSPPVSSTATMNSPITRDASPAPQPALTSGIDGKNPKNSH